MITNGFASGNITYDPKTIYAVFSAGKVNLGGSTSGGFGNCSGSAYPFQYCAYHGYFSYNGNTVLYAAMPYDYSYQGSCTAFQGSGPANGSADPGADAIVNTLAHELEEANTDPRLNAWWDDTSGNENADKCAWGFGTVNLNGGTANIPVGAKNFLVQRNWLNASGGSCQQSYGGAPTTGTLTGTVTNSSGGAAISGATVSISGRWLGHDGRQRHLHDQQRDAGIQPQRHGIEVWFQLGHG